jgi:hypothetical protein
VNSNGMMNPSRPGSGLAPIFCSCAVRYSPASFSPADPVSRPSKRADASACT